MFRFCDELLDYLNGNIAVKGLYGKCAARIPKEYFGNNTLLTCGLRGWPTRANWPYDHNRTDEDDADAHMERQIMGREIVIAISKGKLDFGPWEQIFCGEFDGRRRKRVLVRIIGGD